MTEFQPEQVWLYGSHAWKHPHDDSDVDPFGRRASQPGDADPAFATFHVARRYGF